MMKKTKRMKSKGKGLKKRIFLAGMLAVLPLAFAACGSNQEGSDQGASNQSEDSNVIAESSDTDTVTIQLSTSGTTAPFSFTDEDNNITGYDIDVARAVFDRLPRYDLQIETIELHSTLAEVDAGRCQISANNWNKTSEREEKYYFSDPILDCRYTAVFAEDSAVDSVPGLEELAGLTTILTPASNVAVVLEEYNAANPDKQVIINYSDEDFAKMAEDVQDGKYDFVLYPKVMYKLYNESYGFNLKAVDVGDGLSDSLFNGNPYAYFIIAKDNEQLLKDVNKALAEIQLDGTVKEISEKYFDEDFSASEWYTNEN